MTIDESSLCIFGWLHFEKQQHEEVFKINVACLICMKVHKEHILDAMSRHVGTTFGSCAIGHY